MNQKNAINVINIMKKWALENNLSLLLVGSVGYRSALIRNSEFEKCDDIDCIFIYDDIKQVEKSLFFDDKFYQAVCNVIPQKADMFSIKITIEGIKISADFVSKEYLKELCLESIDNVSKYRLKFTNAIEVPDNTYTNFYGQKTKYNKIWTEYQEYRIYKLPIYLFVDEVFFPGVLLSKYLFNPTLVVVEKEHYGLIKIIQKNIMEYCPEDGSLCNAYYKCSEFSEETKMFLKGKCN